MPDAPRFVSNAGEAPQPSLADSARLQLGFGTLLSAALLLSAPAAG
jgi:hypothetical protein